MYDVIMIIILYDVIIMMMTIIIRPGVQLSGPEVGAQRAQRLLHIYT